MILRAIGKLSLFTLAAIAGLFVVAITCRGDACGSVVSSVLSEVREQPTGNILIEEPLQNTVVETPFSVRGSALVYEGSVFYELTDILGTVLASGAFTTQGRNENELMPFKGSVQYSIPKSPVGKLTLFDKSPKDDRIIDSVSLSLLLTGGEE